MEHWGGDDAIAKDLTPGAEALIGVGQDQGTLFVTPAEELEKQIGSAPVDRRIADFVVEQERGYGVGL